MNANRSNLLFLSAVIIILASLFPRLYILQTLVLTPIYASAALFAVIALVSWAVVRTDGRASSPSPFTPVHRDEHALRALRFTTAAAWSAVLTRQTWEDNPSLFPPIHASSVTSLTARLDGFLSKIKLHFILPWYVRISPSPAFPTAVEDFIRLIVSDTVKRAEIVDWPMVMTARVLPLITDHLQHYRSIEHLSSISAAPGPDSSLPLPLPHKAHPSLRIQPHAAATNTSISPSIEDHLRQTLDRILSVALPEQQQSEVVNIIIREIALGAVLIPVFEMLCDSDFWNRQIDEKGGRYLREQKQVDKFLSALSSLPNNPSSSSPLSPSKSRRATPRASGKTASISAETSSRQFDDFLKSIRKLKTLGEARRLRADVERELRGAKLGLADSLMAGGVGKDAERNVRRSRKYVERLERARVDIDLRIDSLAGQAGGKAADPSNKSAALRGSLDLDPSESVSLRSILADPSSLAYWLEHMERRNRSRLVQYWLTIEGFKDPLEAAGSESAFDSIFIPLSPTELSGQTISEDVTFLYEMYFAAGQMGVEIPTKHRSVIEAAAIRDRAGTMSPTSVQRTKHAVFASQKTVYDQMVEEDWPAFRKSELYLKAITDLKRAAPTITPLSPVPASASHMGFTSPSRISTPLTRPPSLPVRQFSTPAQSSRALLDVLSPTSRTRLSLKQGSITPVAPSTKNSLTPPPFDRTMTDGRIPSVNGVRQLSSSDIDSLRLIPGESPLPPVSRPADPLGILISGEMTQATETRARLFADDDEVEEADEDAFAEAQRMEAIQAALNEIIASDDLASNSIAKPRPPLQSKSPSSASDPFGGVDNQTVRRSRQHIRSQSAEDLKAESTSNLVHSEPSSRMPSGVGFDVVPLMARRRSTSRLSLSPHKSNRHLFDDEFVGEDKKTMDDDDLHDEVHDVIQLAAPGDLRLSVEIARLQNKIQELVQQDHLLDTLIRQAELTGNENELRILRRSQSSVRREQRTAIFQKAQFEQQEEENRLVPGRTRVIIPSSVITAEDGEHGKNVVRYTIEVSQVDDAGQVMLGWVVARRYNEFWELDRAIREWAEGQQLVEELKAKVVEMPGKKLVPSLSASFVESRRLGLERYLQSLFTSTAICDSPLLRSFLSRSPIPLRSDSDTMTSSTGSLASLAPHNIVKSLYKTMATSLDDALLGPSMFDMMYTTLNRQLNEFGGLVGLGGEDLSGLLPQALKNGAYTPQWLKNDPMLSANVTSANAKARPTTLSSPIQPMGGESGMTSFIRPICDLFIEVFDLKENNWLRRQAIVVILQQFLGGTIERKVRDSFRNNTSPDSIERVLGGLEDSLFPGGERRPVSVPRTSEEQTETRLRASRKLGLLIPDVAANMIGRGNARRAARRVFGALQDRRLNQHLMLSIMDEILNAVLPPAR